MLALSHSLVLSDAIVYWGDDSGSWVNFCQDKKGQNESSAYTVFNDKNTCNSHVISDAGSILAWKHTEMKGEITSFMEITIKDKGKAFNSI